MPVLTDPNDEKPIKVANAPIPQIFFALEFPKNLLNMNHINPF